MIVASLLGLKTYNDGKVVDLGDGYKNSLVLRDYLNQNYLNSNTAIIVKRGWRAWGFLQTMYHENIFCTDIYQEPNLIAEATKRNCQYVIYLTKGDGYSDTGVYDNAEILDVRSGNVIEISSKTGNVIANMKKSIVASSLTDGNWTNGVSNADHRTILFENSIYTLHKVEHAKTIIVGDERFRIESVDHDAKWIHMLLDRKADACAYPSELQVE